MPNNAASADPLTGSDTATKPTSGIAAAVAERPKLIKAYDALRRLENYVGTSAAVKAMLTDKMRDGAIRAYAGRSWVSTEQSLKKAWEAGPPSDALRRQLIERRHFVASPSWQSDMQRWKWRAGDFFCGLSSGKRVMYKAVRFAAEDIDAIYRDAKEARTDIFKGSGGRKPSAARDDVWLWIVRKVAEEGRDAVAHKAQVVQSIFRDQGWEKEGPLKTKSVENMVAKAREALGMAKAARASDDPPNVAEPSRTD